MFFSPKPRIEFLCRPDDVGVIPEPVRAKTIIPDWFKALPARDPATTSTTSSGLTVKRCMPFLDAMMTGWIIGLPASVRLNVADGGKTLDAGWDFDRTLVSFHAPAQVKGHPREPSAPAKFHNFWTIRTPPGWSCLFVAPLNRPNPVFEVAAGVVDTDLYQSEIHFPFFTQCEDGLYHLEKGTPMVQVIPFRREATDLDGIIRAETDAEEKTRSTILRNTLSVEGWYRTVARARR